MAQLRKVIPSEAKIAVVEVRGKAFTPDFDKRTLWLLNGMLKDFGYKPNKVARFSLTSSEVVHAADVNGLRAQIGPDFDLILTFGAEAQKYFCRTRKTQDQYAGSLTWNDQLRTWILPTFHPSVVWIGDKKTINKRYDTFDLIYDHVARAIDLVTGKRPYPPVEGHEVPWEWIGHDGEGWDPGQPLGRRVWSGYFEVTEQEKQRQFEVLNHWINSLNHADTPETFALDSESFNTDFFQPLTMVQVYDGQKACAFNWGVIETDLERWRTFLEHPMARFVLANEKHDRKFFRKWMGVDLGDRTMDTLVLALGTTEKGRQTGLKYRSRQDLDAPFYEEELDVWIDKDNVNYGHIRPEILALYGCKDVFYTYHLRPILLDRVKKEGTMKAVKGTLMPAMRTFADIEYTGINIDLAYAQRTSQEWGPKIDAAIKKVQEYAQSVGFPLPDSGIGKAYKVCCGCVPVRGQYHLDGLRVTSYAKALRDAGIELSACGDCSGKRYVTKVDTTLNVNSSQQMQHLCFDILDMKELPNEPRSTCKDFWKFNGNHPLAQLVSEYKELQYLRRNFLDGIQRFIAEDGHVHPDILLFGTKTGRLAIHSPAAQTIPQHGENAKAAKRLFIPDDERSLIVNVDYKSLEMFMAHHLTKDPQLLADLTGEWDIHTNFASSVYKKTPDGINPKERQSVKPVVFGSGYGIGAFKLALDPAMEEATGGDPEIAQQFIDAFWDRYKVWAKQCDVWREQAHSQFYLMTEMGRKRRWNLITADNKNKVSNQAINFAGQSMASDLCLRALIRLHKVLKDNGWGRVLLTVHDSIVFHIFKDKVHEAIPVIVKEMMTPEFETDTPFPVDVTLGPSYGEQDSYDAEKDYTTV